MAKWKKILALGLSVAMVGGLLAACGEEAKEEDAVAADEVIAEEEAVEAEMEEDRSDSEAPEAAAETETETASTTSGDTYKIGYNYYGVGSYALTTLANNEDFVIEAFGNEAVGLSDDFQVDKIVQDIENMISSGCDGLVVWLPADNLYQSVINLCESNGIPFVLADKVPEDESIKEQLLNSEYFAGAVGPANAEYGTLIAEYAIDQGWTSCIISTAAQGDPTDTPRLEAFTEAFEAAGGTIYQTVYTDTNDNIQPYCENALVAYPDVDFIYGTGSDNGIGACAAVQNQRLDVKVVCSGLDSEALDLLADPDSPMVFVNGDFWVSGTMATVALQNFLDGNPLLDADGNIVWVDDIMPFEVSESDYETFQNIFIESDYISADEIRQMSTKNNPDFGYDAFIDFINNYSLEERVAAHEG